MCRTRERAIGATRTHVRQNKFLEKSVDYFFLQIGWRKKFSFRFIYKKIIM